MLQLALGLALLAAAWTTPIDPEWRIGLARDDSQAQIASQPPARSGRNHQEERRPASADGPNESQNHERRTEERPVLVAPRDNSPDHHAVDANAQENGNWYTRPDWWVAVFTAALFFATAALWIVTWRLWRSTRTAVRDGAAALNLANKDFISTHRPRLRVRHFHLEAPIDGQPITIAFAVVNIGETPAYLQLLEPDVRIEPADGGSTREKVSNPFPPNHELQGGAYFEGRATTRKFKYDAGRKLLHHDGRFAGYARISGVIEYADGNGVKRRTAFDRQVIPGNRAFAADAANSDGEYED